MSEKSKSADSCPLATTTPQAPRQPKPVARGLTITEGDCRPDAIATARHFLKTGSLPPDKLDWQFTNEFRFAMGQVPKDILAGFELGEMASFGDVGRRIEAALARKARRPQEYLPGWTEGGRS